MATVSVCGSAGLAAMAVHTHRMNTVKVGDLTHAHRTIFRMILLVYIILT